MMRLIILTWFILFIQGIGQAQSPNLFFGKISTQNGLSNNKVNCIIQDKRGFIWFGTDDGLNRYDGNHFTVFKNTPGNNHTISGNIIMDILEDKEEILWIATADGGLTKYDFRLEPSKQFRQFKNQPGDSTSIPVNIINKVIEDKNGYLWLATNGFFVLRFNKQTEKFNKPVSKGTRNVLALSLRNSNELWAGRQGGGILNIDPLKMTSTMDPRYNDLYAKNLPHVTVTSLFTDSRNNTWYGSWDKYLYKYDAQSKSELTFKEDNPSSFHDDEILSFAESKNGLIWMGGRNKGLHVLNPETNQFYNYQHDPSKGGSIAGNQVNCVYIDRSGLVWLGTNLGVSINNPVEQQFHQQFLSTDNNDPVTIYDFMETKEKDLWIGTSQGLFIRKKGQSNLNLRQIKFKNKNLDITKFYRAASGDLFIGTSYSLFLLDEKDFSVKMLPNTDKDSVMNQIIKSYIITIAEDTVNTEPVLIASPYGHFLAYYYFDKKKWVTRLDSSMNIIVNFNLKDHRIKKIYKSRATGKLYLATTENGLATWEKSEKPHFKFYKNDPAQKGGLSNNNVTDIIEDEKQNLWISTYGGGLHYFNTQKGSATHIPESNNLLEGLQIDRSGKIWVTSNGNIDKFDPVSRIYSSFRLPDLDQSSGVHGNIYRAADGLFYVTGKNYFISFDPLKTWENPSPLPVYITDFRIFNQSYNQFLNERTISLRHTQNYITIEFAAPGFLYETPAAYQYQLTGLNNQWIDLGTENKVSFANLSAGDYSFRLRATNRPGVWYELADHLTITIIPPFWRTWWFFTLFAAAIGGIVYTIYRYRINEILKRQAIRNKIAQDLHDSVGSTLSSIGIYSQVAKIYNDQKKIDQLKDTLEKISETSGNMISEMSDIVWTINPRNDNMPVMLQRMESFAKPLLTAREIQFHLDYDPGIVSLNLGMTQRKNFYLIFKESVNNAIKYSECSNLYVTIRIRNFRLEMLIRDDGKGCDMTVVSQESSRSLSGNGHKNMSVRAREMKGSCEFISSPGQGATIKLQFPIT
jgi:ligand-binding sensor domain-containing protein/two-component sensor histidine kinase